VKRKKKKRVLITGAAGFLGSHLSEHMLDLGYDVIGIDNFSTGRAENIDHLFKNKRWSFIQHDVTNFIHVPGPLDAVLHFASPASPIDYANLPIPTLKVGALGTHKSLGLAKAKKALFMIASTSEVYGDPLVNPQPETYWGNVNPIGPRGVYDEAKRYAEAMTMAYHRFHKMQVRIVRIFNTYGPRMRKKDGRAVPAFITQALKNKPITVFGNGRQTRSLCYVSDLIDGISRLMHSKVNTPVNIGNPTEMTMNQLAKEIKRISGSKSRIVHKSLPEDDPKVRRPNIALAKKKLKWKPQVKLEDGLARTIAYFKK
jgi:dTDP-glucose 4,6-dehydratase